MFSGVANTVGANSRVPPAKPRLNDARPNGLSGRAVGQALATHGRQGLKNRI